MAAIAYYDTVEQAAGEDLSAYTDVVTLGYSKKNDGGGAHYKRYPVQPGHPLRFEAHDTSSATTYWGLVPDGGVVNPLQAGAVGDGDPDHNDRDALQKCIDFIAWWADAAGTQIDGELVTMDSSRTAVKLIIPGGDHVFVVDRRDLGAGTKGDGLNLTGPITIEGEDRLTSRIRFVEATNESADGDPAGGTSHGQANSLFYTSRELTDETSTSALITGITLRNFTITGSYGNPDLDGDETVYQSNGNASILTVYRMDDVLLENMVFERNRAVMINGGQTRNFTMRGCVMSECRRGGLVITDAENVVVEDNDFRWVSDDPVAITMGADTAIADDDGTGPDEASSGNTAYLAAGGLVRIVGNRCFGCRGLNVVGSKNVLIADNTHVLGRGRAIHIGCVTDQDKGDTSTLNVIVRNNIITDLLNSGVDPEADDLGRDSQRAIDIEMLQTAPNPVGTPGWPANNGTIVDPASFHYSEGQGLQGRRIWTKGDTYKRYAPVNPAHPKTEEIKAGQTWWLGRIYKATDDPATVFVEGNTERLHPPVHTDGSVVWDGNGPGTAKPGVPWKYVAPGNVLPQPQSPTPYSGNILIESNIISRTRPAVDAFIDYGVGPWGGFVHAYDEPNDVAVTLDAITPDQGIGIGGSVRNLVIRGNQIRNCDVGILFYGKNVDMPFSLVDVILEDNDLFDWKTAGIRFQNYDFIDATGQSPVTRYYSQRVSILNNRADGDPYHWNEAGNVRLSQGKWADTTATITIGSRTLAPGYGAFVDATNLGMVVIAGNHVRNVPQLVAGLSDVYHVMQGNVAYCNPADLAVNEDVGYDPDNIGVGNLIKPQLGWRYVIEEGNPGQANYGKLFNPCPLALPADVNGKPDQTFLFSKRWVKGTYVTNLTPSKIGTGATAYEIAGWRRMTTGTGNGLNADWQQQRVLTG